MTVTSTPLLTEADQPFRGEEWVLYHAHTRAGIYLGLVGALHPPHGRVWDAIPVVYPGTFALSRRPPAELTQLPSKEAAARRLATFRRWWWPR
jgi:hypothetical protein